MQKCDVLIVGGGPGGATCARELCHAGLDVVVLDKAVFPRDKVCAGWITPAVLDAIGVELESQERGVGQSLMEELVDKLRAIGVRTLHSQADWTDSELLRFFTASGFKLAPRLALERSVTKPLIEQSEDA